MKLVASMLILFFSINLASAAEPTKPSKPKPPAGWRESYGGELPVAEFKSLAYKIFKNISPANYYKISPNLNQDLATESIQNSKVVCKSNLVLDGVAKDAINYPLSQPQRIELDCKKWENSSYESKLKLATHEFLFLNFIDDTTYEISSHIVADYFKNQDQYESEIYFMLITTIADCQPKYYRIILDFPQNNFITVGPTVLRTAMQSCLPIFEDMLSRDLEKGMENSLYSSLADLVLTLAETGEAVSENDLNHVAEAARLLKTNIPGFEKMHFSKFRSAIDIVRLRNFSSYSCYDSSGILQVLATEYSESSSEVKRDSLKKLIAVLSAEGFPLGEKNACGVSAKNLMSL